MDNIVLYKSLVIRSHIDITSSSQLQMLKLFLVLFVYTVPVAMVHKLGFFTIPVAMMLCVGCVRVWWWGWGEGMRRCER